MMQQFDHGSFEPYALQGRSLTRTFDRESDYSLAYRAPVLPGNIIQDLLDAGFEYHLPANNEAGFWTHPTIAKVLFSTYQAMSRLGIAAVVEEGKETYTKGWSP